MFFSHFPYYLFLFQIRIFRKEFLFFQVPSTQMVPLTNPFLAQQFSTSQTARDIEAAAKFIGAGAATVGAAGKAFFLFFMIKTIF